MGFFEAMDKMGHVTRHQVVWAGVAAVLAASGPGGRRAAVRGGVAHGITLVAANVVIKPLVGRRRPAKSRRRLVGPATTSFPSGHAATDLAFVFALAQEVPGIFLPLAFGTVTAHWSLIRTGRHYASDVFVGGAIGIGIAAAMAALWPSDRRTERGAAAVPEDS